MRKLSLFLCTILLCTMCNYPIQAVELNNESLYGKKLTFSSFNEAYKGEMSVTGIYIYEEDDEYYVTVLYEGGELLMVNQGGNMYPNSSFFNPPGGSVIKFGHYSEWERLETGDGFVRFRVEKEKLESVSSITIFLKDKAIDDDDGSDILLNFDLKSFDFDTVPLKGELVNGFNLNNSSEITSVHTPAAWAKEDVEALYHNGLVKEDMFTDYSEGITRLDFIYMMVRVYEKVVGTSIAADSNITFTDTTDIYAKKAATVGITNGIGDGLFGPDVLLNREQMTTMIIRTLELAGIDMTSEVDYNIFDDDSNFSSWSKSSIYKAKAHGIMSGIGDNLFSPATIATREQALVIVKRLLVSYSQEEWLAEFDNDRFYVRIDDKIYKMNLREGFVINSEDVEAQTLYFEDYNDLEDMIHVASMNQFRYDESDNPNIEGTIVRPDFIDMMTVDVVAQYVGVDKVGEVTNFLFDGEVSNGNYEAKIVTNIDGKVTKSSGFETITYKKLDGEYTELLAFSVEDVLEAIDIPFSLEYHEDWGIYIATLD